LAGIVAERGKKEKKKGLEILLIRSTAKA